jgi:hypothetical protein
MARKHSQVWTELDLIRHAGTVNAGSYQDLSRARDALDDQRVALAASLTRRLRKLGWAPDPAAEWPQISSCSAATLAFLTSMAVVPPEQLPVSGAERLARRAYATGAQLRRVMGLCADAALRIEGLA